MGAAVDFLATHPPLRCFAFEGSDGPSLHLLDAVLELKARRPALQLCRLNDPEDATLPSYAHMLEGGDLPEPTY